MTAWSRKTYNVFEQFFAFFGKTTLFGKIFKIRFRKFTWRHRLTLLCSNVVKCFRREIGKIVRYLPHKKRQNSAPCQTVASVRIAPKIWRGHSVTFGSDCSRFHTIRFNCGGRICETGETGRFQAWSKPVKDSLMIQSGESKEVIGARIGE